MRPYITVLTILLLPTTLAFQQASLSPCCKGFTARPTNPRVVRIDLRLAASDDREDEPAKRKLPFFARVVKKIVRKKDAHDGSTTTLTEDASTTSAHEEDSVAFRALQMKAMATRTRLEAERDELQLALDKISKLEAKVDRLDEHPSWREEVYRETRLLIERLDPPSLQQNLSMELPIESKDEQPPLLPPDKRDDAITGFSNLPPPLQDAMARSAGLPKGSNATIVIDKLMSENRLMESNDTFAFSATLNKEDFDEDFMLDDVRSIQTNNFVETLLPQSTRERPLDAEYVDAFYKEVCGKTTFQPSGKPEAVPGGYIVRGSSRFDEERGDLLMEAIDTKLKASSVYQKIGCYYIYDPTPRLEEDTMEDDDEVEKVLLLTDYNVSPSTDLWVKPLVSIIGIASIGAFALGSFSMNMDVVDQVSKAAENGDDLGWLYDLSLPVVQSILGIQLAHEAGHAIVALKDGISIGPPTLVPSVSLGITGAITPIKSPPKNVKSLFDFAIAGPVLGLITSMTLLYVGLEMTAFADAVALEKCPSVPISLIRSSTLVSGIIEYLLGDGLLNSPDPTISLIKLHPYAIAGFAGLVTNALSLLPIGNTDGGRISLAFFGRSLSRVVQGTAILLLAFCGLFGADESGIFIAYALYCQFFQKETEIPCRNEVDELDSIRGLVAIMLSVVVVLTLIPLSS